MCREIPAKNYEEVQYYKNIHAEMHMQVLHCYGEYRIKWWPPVHEIAAYLFL